MIPGISDSGAGNYTNQRLYTYKAIVKKNAAGQYYIPNQPTIDKVPAFMFYGCTSLKTIKLPNVAVIGFAAFSGSGLTELQLPARTIEIHQWALRNCASLTKLDYSLVDANTLVMVEPMVLGDLDMVLLPTVKTSKQLYSLRIQLQV